MLLYLRVGSAQTIARAATPRQKLHSQRALSPSRSILKAGQPVPALTLSHLAGYSRECQCLSHWHHWTWGRHRGFRRPSSDDSVHSPTVIPPSALDKPSIMKRYHRRRTCSHTSPRRSPTMVTLHDTRFVECR